MNLKIIYSCILIFLLCSCSDKYQPESEVLGTRMNVITAEVPNKEESSRVTIQDDKRIFWSKGDAFVAFTDQNDQAIYSLDGEGNSSTGIFSTVDVFDGLPVCAVYPYHEHEGNINAKIDHKVLKIVLPDEYLHLDKTQHIPMWGNIERKSDGTNSIRFHHLMSVIKLELKKLPTEYTHLQVTASNVLSGPFKMELESASRKLMPDNDIKENRSLKITIDRQQAVCYIPMPSGFYENIKVYGLKTGRKDLVFEISDRNLVCGYMYTIGQLMNRKVASAWEMFDQNSPDNVLLDYSYAGYMHGEIAPPDAFSLGYKVLNVKDEMAKRGKSARETFIELLQENRLHAINGRTQDNPMARLVFYFPEGDYVLHNENDNSFNPSSKNVMLPGFDASRPYDPLNIASGSENKAVAYGMDSKGMNTTSCIIITGGNFIIKGAGRDKPRILMESPALPTDPRVLYSSPNLMLIKHNAGMSELCDVVSDVDKGAYSLEISNPELVKIGDWICLCLMDNSKELIDKELFPHSFESYMSDIASGIKVNDYHQIAKKEGNVITFKEPVMHEVDHRWNWKIMKYRHYENVGIEDLTFVGKCVDDFKHHRSWIDDGAYKPVSFNRIVNSWMRRVDFENVSEACSVTGSANVSVYDVNIKGNRGHSAIRSAGSSRVFIGAVTDRTSGPKVSDRIFDATAGQYHACGVSKPSMGAVIWRVHWGTDGCFESHATQPRATLIDHCYGGFIQSRQGGASDQVPNHLNDLTIWNMNVEQVGPLSNKGTAPEGGKFDWWRYSTASKLANNWKFLPPVLVGFHGLPIDFVEDPKQIKYEESTGEKVEPESLYEAQLERRLGEIPGWLKALKK